MNRIQKKCVIASTSFHALLLVILFVGPAFLSQKEKPDDSPVLTFIPVITTDADVQGGGNPKARPPAPTPPTPEPPKPEVKRTTPAPDTAPPEPKPEVKPRVPKISTEIKTRPRDAKPTPKQTNQKSDAQARADAKAREQFKSALNRLHENLSSSTTVEMPGPGGGGLPYANFLAAVKTVYTEAWIVPDGVTDDSATTTASVTIARDGTVLAARIIQPSGNALADQSVRATLDRVKFAAPLPRDAKEDQRTVTIKFNVRAKRMVG